MRSKQSWFALQHVPFELPESAQLLARSALYPHQAFRVGACAYGLQFHVELDGELAAAWREHLPAGVSLPASACTQVERAGRRVLRAFFALADAPGVSVPRDKELLI